MPMYANVCQCMPMYANGRWPLPTLGYWSSTITILHQFSMNCRNVQLLGQTYFLRMPTHPTSCWVAFVCLFCTSPCTNEPSHQVCAAIKSATFMLQKCLYSFTQSYILSCLFHVSIFILLSPQSMSHSRTMGTMIKW